MEGGNQGLKTWSITFSFTVFIFIFLRLHSTNGQAITLVKQLATSGEITQECQNYVGTGSAEFVPATNDDVDHIIDVLAGDNIWDNVWLKSTYDSSVSILDNAFSWTSEPVDTDLWFQSLDGFSEPDKLEQQCTLLRRKIGSRNSVTGKHMLGNKFCTSDTAMFLCIVPDTTTPTMTTIPTPPPITTPSATTTTTITTTTTTPPPTPPPTPPSTTTTPPPTTSKSTQTTSAANIIQTSTSLTSTHTDSTTTATSIGLSVTSHPNPQSSNQLDTVPVNVCPCQCPTNIHRHTNMSAVDIQQLINQIRRNLSIDPRTTSMASRKKMSSPDDRSTAQSIGVMAIVTLTVTYGIIVCLDLNRVYILFVEGRTKNTKLTETPRTSIKN